MTKICICHDSEKHGQTSVMCCNRCGLPDEDFWQPSPSTEVKGQQDLHPTIKDILDEYDFIEFENGKYYHRSVVINAMAEYASHPSQPPEVGQDELWDGLISEIALWLQDDDDTRARTEFRAELINSFTLIKK